MTEPCVFILWETARPAEQRILADLKRHFAVHDVVEVSWPPELFSRNLTRLYGQALPSGSDKEQQCGLGPFLVIIASDPRARYGLRRTTRGVRRVSTHAARAKARYRRWTGGGFRVHGSLDRSEAERDLRLLLREPADARAAQSWDGVVRAEAPTATDWSDAKDLVAAIASATPARLLADEGLVVRISAEDVWWAIVIAGGDAPAADAREAECQVHIGGESRRLLVSAAAPPPR
ncbi:MAG: hypothetical protein H0X39_16445 [Actinobacteria bacterium]|nr:hypothetical protein [Actinomycetota bacterium]